MKLAQLEPGTPDELLARWLRDGSRATEITLAYQGFEIVLARLPTRVRTWQLRAIDTAASADLVRVLEDDSALATG